MRSKYDVFISCKSEDYHQANEVYTFLEKNGVSVFLANESLRQRGDADYGNAIDDALEECTHLIVFCTNTEYTRATYVKSEWSTFRNEKRAGRKTGNLLSVISDSCDINNLPIALRNFQVLFISSFKMELLKYLPCDSNGGHLFESEQVIFKIQ